MRGPTFARYLAEGVLLRIGIELADGDREIVTLVLEPDPFTV
jgi:hypothetical protein